MEAAAHDTLPGFRVTFVTNETTAMNATTLDEELEAKMRSAGVPQPTITAFLGAVHKLMAGERGLLPESVVEPVSSLPRLILDLIAGLRLSPSPSRVESSTQPALLTNGVYVPDFWRSSVRV